MNRSYPAENRELPAEIVERGMVLSQFWPDAPPQKQSFLMRNALMSRYGWATIVVGRNEWARALVRRPAVHVVSGWREIGPIMEKLRSQPNALMKL